ncbi:MAG TPA: hypothetical protein VKA80_06805 [Beijerinckiaceae bacterium]|jgi:hypothetical protein|nr:hypothetical protein [Beijerinckiaceae bacterium]
MAAFASTNVVPFRSARRQASTRRDQKGLMEAVYTAGSLPLQAGDRESKVMAARLQVFGFVLIDEIQSDGTLRRMRPSEAIEARTNRPWRVSKPSFSGLAIGLPDADDSLFEPQPA